MAAGGAGRGRCCKQADTRRCRTAAAKPGLQAGRSGRGVAGAGLACFSSSTAPWSHCPARASRLVLKPPVMIPALLMMVPSRETTCTSAGRHSAAPRGGALIECLYKAAHVLAGDAPNSTEGSTTATLAHVHGTSAAHPPGPRLRTAHRPPAPHAASPSGAARCQRPPPAPAPQCLSRWWCCEQHRWAGSRRRQAAW